MKPLSITFIVISFIAFCINDFGVQIFGLMMLIAAVILLGKYSKNVVPIIFALFVLMPRTEAQIKPVKPVIIKVQEVKPVPVNKVFNLDIKSEEDNKRNATLTTNTAIFEGVTYPAYVTNKSNKLFIIIPDTKNLGNYKRKYINY